MEGEKNNAVRRGIKDKRDKTVPKSDFPRNERAMPAPTTKEAITANPTFLEVEKIMISMQTVRTRTIIEVILDRELLNTYKLYWVRLC